MHVLLDYYYNTQLLIQIRAEKKFAYQASNICVIPPFDASSLEGKTALKEHFILAGVQCKRSQACRTLLFNTMCKTNTLTNCICERPLSHLFKSLNRKQAS